MSRIIEFAKLSGSGNDFLCIDNRDGRFDDLLNSPAQVGHFARTCCRRGVSVGADGIIFASASEVEGFADLGARHFEPDGSEAELCGNGVACFTRWVLDNGWVTDDEVKILTTAGVVRGKRIDEHYTRVCIPLPEGMEQDVQLDVLGQRWMCDRAVCGTPHVIAYVPNVDDVDIARLGPAIRYHERFAPRGANANFVQVLAPGRLAVRTWEFGVEGETLACGTGSAAAAILAAKRFAWDARFTGGQEPVLVRAASGDTLRVYLTLDAGGAVSDLCLESRVRFVYIGRLHEELAELAMNAPKQSRGA